MNLNFQSIDHIHVNVTDRSSAEKWYDSVLGFKRITSLVFWAEGGGPLTIQNESGSIHIALFENSSVQNTTIAFKVSASGLKSCIEHLARNDISAAPVDHELCWSIYFRDPDGNPYEITTYEYDEFKSK